MLPVIVKGFTARFTGALAAPSRRLVACVCLALLWGCSQGPHIFDPDLNPDEALSAAVAEAARDNKAVLVVFGADWCPVCRSFEADLEQPPLAPMAAEHYVVIKVDVGDFDRNTQFAERLGKPTRAGIPALAVVDATGALREAVPAYDLARWRSGGAEATAAELTRLASAAPGR